MVGHLTVCLDNKAPCSVCVGEISTMQHGNRKARESGTSRCVLV